MSLVWVSLRACLYLSRKGSVQFLSPSVWVLFWKKQRALGDGPSRCCIFKHRRVKLLGQRALSLAQNGFFCFRFLVTLCKRLRIPDITASILLINIHVHKTDTFIQRVIICIHAPPKKKKIMVHNFA